MTSILGASLPSSLCHALPHIADVSTQRGVRRAGGAARDPRELPGRGPEPAGAEHVHAPGPAGAVHTPPRSAGEGAGVAARGRCERPRDAAAVHDVGGRCGLICTVPAKTAPPPPNVPSMLYIPSSISRVSIFNHCSEKVGPFYGLDGLRFPLLDLWFPGETTNGSSENHVDLQRAVSKVCWMCAAAHGCGKGTHRRPGRQVRRGGRKRCQAVPQTRQAKNLGWRRTRVEAIERYMLNT
jgi:hypothetical protein